MSSADFKKEYLAICKKKGYEPIIPPQSPTHFSTILVPEDEEISFHEDPKQKKTNQKQLVTIPRQLLEELLQALGREVAA